MLKIHVIMAILGGWRLTEMLSIIPLQDGSVRANEMIFAPILLFIARWNWMRSLLTCTRCLSVWMGIAATLLFVYFPYANWPLAMSILYSMTGRVMESLPRSR